MEAFVTALAAEAVAAAGRRASHTVGRHHVACFWPCGRWRGVWAPIPIAARERLR